MSGTMKIRFTRLNFEHEWANDCITKRGFTITEPPFSDVDKQIRNLHGPRSPLYGTTYGDTNEFAERYACKCGRTVGSAFEGEICEFCGQPVKDRDVDIKFTGWLSFSQYKIINPLYYHSWQSALSRKILEGIISNENIITPQGVIRKHDEALEVKKTSMMYWNIG